MAFCVWLRLWVKITIQAQNLECVMWQGRKVDDSLRVSQLWGANVEWLAANHLVNWKFNKEKLKTSFFISNYKVNFVLVLKGFSCFVLTF